MQILLVEDETNLATALAALFEKRDIHATLAADGVTGDKLARENTYDVIVLDIMLPGMSGLDILKHIRAAGNDVPVLLLTAKDSTTDKVKGLNIGADDYVVKPFDTEELIARIRALARRGRKENDTSASLTYADLTLDISAGKLDINGGKTVRLTSKESRVLEMLMRSPDKIISKADIAEKVWDEPVGDADNAAEIYIHYLRKKLDGAKAHIKTVRKRGYLLTDA